MNSWQYIMSTTMVLKIIMKRTTNLSMAIVRKGLSTTMGREREGEHRKATAKSRGRGDLCRILINFNLFILNRSIYMMSCMKYGLITIRFNFSDI